MQELYQILFTHMCYALCAMCYVLCAMCYVLCAMCYVLCVTHLMQESCQIFLYVICYVLCVMCYASYARIMPNILCVMCYVLCAMCYVLHILSLCKNYTKYSGMILAGHFGIVLAWGVFKGVGVKNEKQMEEERTPAH